VTTKVDLLRYLAHEYGCRRYLEYCTPTTGGYYAETAGPHFTVRHRLMYRCPDGYDDGEPIDFRSRDLDVSVCLDAIRNRAFRYDLILVDAWHAYGTSRRDIEAAIALLTPGGFVVAHDCLPPDEATTAPDFVPGTWCGLTYQAYLDVVTSRRDVKYRTVDIDFGCGVVQKLTRSAQLEVALRRTARGLLRRPQPSPGAALVRTWRGLSPGDPARYRLFAANAHALLRLVNAKDFARQT
jgi:hypothetical protein